MEWVVASIAAVLFAILSASIQVRQQKRRHAMNHLHQP